MVLACTKLEDSWTSALTFDNQLWFMLEQSCGPEWCRGMETPGKATAERFSKVYPLLSLGPEIYAANVDFRADINKPHDKGTFGDYLTPGRWVAV